MDKLELAPIGEEHEKSISRTEKSLRPERQESKLAEEWTARFGDTPKLEAGRGELSEIKDSRREGGNNGLSNALWVLTVLCLLTAMGLSFPVLAHAIAAPAGLLPLAWGIIATGFVSLFAAFKTRK